MLAKVLSGRCFHHASFYCSKVKSPGRIITSTSCSNVPDPPKNPNKPFVQFASERLEELRKMSESKKRIPMKWTIKSITDMWNNLAVEDKMVYDEMFSKEWLEYKILKQQWWNNLSEEQKSTFLDAKNRKDRTFNRYALRKKLRLLGKPKRPTGCFLKCCLERKNADGKLSFKNNVSLWRNMSLEEKQPYIDASKEEFKVYQIKLHVWELQMMKMGHGDLLQQLKSLNRLIGSCDTHDPLPQTDTEGESNEGES